MFSKWFKKSPESIYQKRFNKIIRNKKLTWDLFKKFPLGMHIISTDGKMLGNDALWKSSGIHDEKDFEEYKKTHLDRMNRIRKLLSEEESMFYDFPVREKDGSEHYLREHVSGYRDEKGELLFYIGYVLDITQKKIVQDNLKESTEKYQTLTEELPIGIYQSDVAGNILYINNHLLSIFGYQSFDQISNRNILDVYYDKPMRQKVLERISKATGIWSFEFESRNRFDAPLWLKITGKTVYTESGEVIYFYGLVENLTLQKQTEKALHQSEIKFKHFTDLLPETLFEVDEKGYFSYLNKTAKRVFGYDEQDETPRLWEIIAPESIERLKRNFFKASIEDYGTDNEYLGQKKDGTKIPITVYAHPFFENNILKGYRGILINLSEKKKNEEKYRSLIEKSLDGILIHRNGIVLFANEVAYNMFGYKKGTSLNLYTDLIHPDEEEKFISYHLKRLQGKEVPSIYETIFINQDGKPLAVELNNSVIDWENEKAVMSVVRDLTLRNKTENELLRLGTAINQIHEAVVITDTNGIIEYVNPAFEKLTQYRSAEVLGRKTNILKSGKHPQEFYHKMWHTITTGNIWSGVLINKRKDEELFEEHCVISPIKNNVGKVVNYIAIKRDITEERRIEKQMRQTQKLQAIGTLAGGIAHDFNNLLMAMQLFTDLTVKSIPKDHKAQEHLQRIQETQQRGKDLINQILTFSRNTDEDYKEPILIHYAVTEALKIIRSTLPATVKFVEKIEDCGYITGNLTHVQQILMNLFTNASQAMEGNGTITFTLEKTDFGEDTSTQFARLIIKDTGSGMDRTTRERIFEPFYTTKKVGHGTGLGMTTVHSIVKQYNGEIFFSSEIGKGTTFYIYLPLLSKT
jgi:PAS domain S-box-containing protein